MKRIVLFSVLLLACYSSAYSQYFIVKVGGGYSWPGFQNSTGVITFQPASTPDPANSVVMPLFNYNTSATDSIAGKKYRANVYGGYGKGGHFDFAFGYMINPYFGVQIDGAYLWGSSVSGTQTFDDPLLGNNVNIQTSTHSMGLSINPSLVFRAAKPDAKVAPYARAGIALPVQGGIYHTLHISAANTPFGNLESSTIDIKTMPTVSVGFQGVVGISYTPVPLITVFAEVGGQYLFVKAQESDLTTYNLNFDGQLGTQNMLADGNSLNGGKAYSTFSRVTNFVDELNSSSNTTGYGKKRDLTGAHNGDPNYVDESKPQDRLRQTANLGALGISVGVNFNLSKKIFQDPFGKKAKATSNGTGTASITKY